MQGGRAGPYTPARMAGAKKASKSPKGGKKTAGGKASSPPGVETLLDELDSVVEDLERGELPLEEALDRFERGVSLARESHAALDAMEQRVEHLIADRDGVALEDEEDDDGDD